MTQVGLGAAQFGFDINDASEQHHSECKGVGVERQIRAKALACSKTGMYLIANSSTPGLDGAATRTP